MNRTLVGVNYKNEKTGEFDGRTYSYYCELAVKVGDIVIAPTARGDAVARIFEVDVPSNKIDERIEPLLKTITSFAEQEG